MIRGTFRIYPKTMKARNLLLQQGVTIGAVHVNIMDKSPNIVKDQSNPAEKLIIGNIPLSLATEEIHKAIKALGVSFRSNWFDERYRNDKNELSLFKTGRRFIYIDIPQKPLPKSLIIGDFNASIYHKSQKTPNVSPPELELSGRPASTPKPSNIPMIASQSEKGKNVTPKITPVVPSGSNTKPTTKSADAGKPRPTVRSLTRAANRKPKRQNSESRSPSVNSPAKRVIKDYFEFNNSSLEHSQSIVSTQSPNKNTGKYKE